MTVGSQFLLLPVASQNTNGIFTWNPEWISSYESPWGILEKFKFANAATDRDIFDVFGSKQFMGEKHKVVRKIDRNLITLSGINEHTVFRTLGYNLKRRNQHHLESTIGVLPITHYESYIRTMLTYCPKCIKNGYHSIFHQITLIDTCPFHDSPLYHHCPKCHNEIPYKISDKATHSPFVCICKYCFLGKDPILYFTEKWKAKNKQIKSPHLNTWLNLSEQQKKWVKKIYIYNDVAEQRHENIIPVVLSVLDEAIYY